METDGQNLKLLFCSIIAFMCFSMQHMIMYVESSAESKIWLAIDSSCFDLLDWLLFSSECEMQTA